MLCRRLFSPVLCAVTHGWRTLKTRKHSPYFARVTGKLDVEGASPSLPPPRYLSSGSFMNSLWECTPHFE